MSDPDQDKVTRNIHAWTERAEIARKQGQDDVVEICDDLVAIYQSLAGGTAVAPEMLAKANLLRKRIESTEQHRTMSVEHGLGNEAIDATYEIKELENELLELVRNWKLAK
jgi:hypothetical protein